MVRIVIACERCYGSEIRSWTVSVGGGLHLPREETPSVEQGEVDLTSFGDAVVVALSGNQAAEAQLYLVNSNADDDISFSSESMSLIWVKCAVMVAQKNQTATAKWR